MGKDWRECLQSWFHGERECLDAGECARSQEWQMIADVARVCVIEVGLVAIQKMKEEPINEPAGRESRTRDEYPGRPTDPYSHLLVYTITIHIHIQSQ